MTPPSRPFGLLLYFTGAYAWTWAFDFVKILGQRHIVPVPLPLILLDITAGLGPLLAALAVTSYEAGRTGRRALLGQLLRWRGLGRWFAIATLGPVLLTAITYALWLGTGGSRPPAEALAQWTLLPVFFAYILLFGGGVDEELGWRGYALPRLQQRYGAAIASVILGVAWAGWHIPAWFTPGSGQDVNLIPGLRGQRRGSVNSLHLDLQRSRREPGRRDPGPHGVRRLHDRTLVAGALHTATRPKRPGSVQPAHRRPRDRCGQRGCRD